MEVFWIAAFTVLGTVIGSFLNVCVDRLPARESLIYPPSHCSACQHRLSAIDLVPVFSYLWLRGRCRYCQASISQRLLWVEAVTGVLFGFAYWHYGFSIDLPVILVYFCLFLVLLVIDLEHGLILNKLNYPAMVMALLFSLFLSQSEIVPGIKQAGIGAGICLGLFLLIAVVSRGGMGWGDVKMAALIGLVIGYPLMFVALLLAVFLGGLVGVFLLTLKKKGRKGTVPFGPFLSLATIVTLLWGSDILNWYKDLFQLS